MILCDDWWSDPERENRITISGLLTSIRPAPHLHYPIAYREICVFLLLTEGYGRGSGKIVCLSEETGKTVFETGNLQIPFTSALDVVGVPFRIQHCIFPTEGIYTVQFWYEGEMLEERPLRLR